MLLNNEVIAGLSGDENGDAILNNQKFDTLKITCIGYADLLISKKEITRIAYLTPIDINLEEVYISNKTETINYKGKKGRYLGMLKDVEFILFFKNVYNKSVRIKSFSITTKKTIVENTIRIVMYRVTDPIHHRKPGENLMTQDIVFTLATGKEGITTIDLTEYNIELPPEGAYLGIDVIEVRDINGNYSYDKNHMNEFETVKSREKTLLANDKFTSKGWQNLNFIWEESLRLYPHISNQKNNFVIPTFSIEVYTD